MAITSTNPATGDVFRVFAELTDDQVDAKLAEAAPTFRYLPKHHLRPAFGLDGRRCRHPRGRGRDGRPSVDLGDGKDLVSARLETLKCAEGVPLLRRTRRRISGRRAGRRRGGRSHHRLRPVRAARPGACGHAVELPPLAGDPLRRPGTDGRQRRAAQARLQRPPDRPSSCRTCSTRAGFPSGCLPDAAHRIGARSRPSSATTGWWPSP